MGYIKKVGKKWKAEVSLGSVDGQRKRIAKSGFSKKSEAEEWADEQKSLYKHGYSNINNKLTVNDIMDKWFKEICSSKSENTRYNSQSRINCHIKPELGNILLNKLSVSDVQNFYNNLRLNGLKPNSIKKIIETLNSGLKYAYKLKLISHLPIDIEKITARKEPIQFYTKEEVSFILKELNDSWCYLPVLIVVMTGIRSGELCGLQWKDIDFKNKTLTINKQVIRAKGSDNTYKVIVKSDLKTQKSKRTITISDILLSTLDECKNSIQNNKRTDFIITTKSGNICYPDYIRNEYKKAFMQIQKKHKLELLSNGHSSEDADDLQIKKMPFYNFRHTHATILLNLDINIKVISERLGHTSIKTTLDCYSGILPKSEKAPAELFDSLFKLNS